MMCDPKALTASFSMNIFHMMLCAADVNGKGMIKNRQGKMYHWLSKDPPPHVWIDAAHKSTHNIYSHDAWLYWSTIFVFYIWVKFLRAYRAWIWCHIFCIFERLFRQLRGVLHQNFWHFLKIYKCHIVYIPLFWPFLHRGPCQLPIHFSIPQKIIELQSIICSLFRQFLFYLVII